MAQAVVAGWARFWAVDLHVHTPGSNDASDAHFGGPEDIVQVAINQGLDAIAVTDHNTAAWCDRMTDAAQDTSLVVLPGVELSTREGHLLGIWEEGTAAQHIEDVLLQLGVSRADFGKTDITAAHGMGECAAKIEAAGGLAIAAHIDKERGLLRQQVQTYVNELLSHPHIAGFEYVLAETPATVAAKLRGARTPALVRHSDAFSAELSRHDSSAIGNRRTWYKAARPDLVGIQYAMEDPGLRVRVTDPAATSPHPSIERVEISAGFLGGTVIDLSPDLNCLLGGTGAGKSLVVEAIRFAVDQQVDAQAFATIREEVDLRLSLALGIGTSVQVTAIIDGETYRVSRRFTGGVSAPEVAQRVGADWVPIERSAPQLLPIAGFSQGEILEYSRQPVGRVGLIDAHLDLQQIDAQIAEVSSSLARNATSLIEARERALALTEKAAKASGLGERANELSGFFDEKLVDEQRNWAGERSDLEVLRADIDTWRVQITDPPTAPQTRMNDHEPLFARLQEKRATLDAAVARGRSEVAAARTALREELVEVRKELDASFIEFEGTIRKRLDESGQSSMTSLMNELQSVQAELAQATAAEKELSESVAPNLTQLAEDREGLLAKLHEARAERRDLRRRRVKALNKETAGIVRLDVPNESDRTEYRALLEKIKVGSRLTGPVLNTIAERIHPYSLARAIWSGDHSLVGELPDGVNATDIARLQTNISDQSLWSELLTLQVVEMPDTLNVKFKKPEGGDYVPIEHLSHGQKCTAVLVILLADGHTPVIVDQPEDALHAPWIEEYLVDRLRELRGSRQYLFATRSAGLVVSADAEQLVTMKASAERGEIEARGSLERHNVNTLALHHLEGGKVPFDRRARKLRASINA